MYYCYCYLLGKVAPVEAVVAVELATTDKVALVDSMMSLTTKTRTKTCLYDAVAAANSHCSYWH